MSVAVGVDTDDGIDEFCQHGHWPGPFCWARVDIGTGLDGITEPGSTPTKKRHTDPHRLML